MQIKISSPKHYEIMYGSSNLVRAYLDQIEKTLGEGLSSEVFDILRVSLLIAHPDELAQGKFLAFEIFDWRCKYAAVGVNGNFERYHLGNDQDKICELSEMLQSAFMRISKKKKAKFNCALANELLIHTTQAFIETFREK